MNTVYYVQIQVKGSSLALHESSLKFSIHSTWIGSMSDIAETYFQFLPPALSSPFCRGGERRWKVKEVGERRAQGNKLRKHFKQTWHHTTWITCIISRTEYGCPCFCRQNKFCFLIHVITIHPTLFYLSFLRGKLPTQKDPVKKFWMVKRSASE